MAKGRHPLTVKPQGTPKPSPVVEVRTTIDPLKAHLSASDSEVCHRDINGFVVPRPGVPREKRLPLILTEQEAKIDHAVSHSAFRPLSGPWMHAIRNLEETPTCNIPPTHHFLVAGSQCLMTFRGTHTGPFRGIPPTGKQGEIKVVKPVAQHCAIFAWDRPVDKLKGASIAWKPLYSRSLQTATFATSPPWRLLPIWRTSSGPALCKSSS